MANLANVGSMAREPGGSCQKFKKITKFKKLGKLKDSLSQFIWFYTVYLTFVCWSLFGPIWRVWPIWRLAGLASLAILASVTNLASLASLGAPRTCGLGDTFTCSVRALCVWWTARLAYTRSDTVLTEAAGRRGSISRFQSSNFRT